MRMRKEYVPKRNDRVRVKGSPGACVILFVNSKRKTAHLSTLTSPVILYYDVRWAELRWISSVPGGRLLAPDADAVRSRAGLL